MIKQILHTHRAENYKTIVRLFSFLFIGGVGAMVNLLCFSGVYYALWEITNSYIAYGMAFVVGTEVSIVSNFILNDRLTFGDLHARSWQAGCLRYHVTSIGGVLLTLGSSFSLLHLLHVPTLSAQATALIIAMACNFVLHNVFTYGRIAVQSTATQVELTYRVMMQGFQMVETPIVFMDRRCGKSKMSRAIILEALTYVLRTRLRQQSPSIPHAPLKAL